MAHRSDPAGTRGRTSLRPRLEPASTAKGADRPGLLPGSDTSSAGRARESALIRIVLDAGSELITEVHAFVTAYATKRFRPSLAQSLSIATYELLENGLNYGSVVEPVVFELLGSAEPEIAVTNVAVGSRIALLSSRVDALASDAEAVYMEEMRRSMSGGAQRAMLGLARVIHEAKMRVSIELAEQRVTVRARSGR